MAAIELPRRARHVVLLGVLFGVPLLLWRAELRDPEHVTTVDRILLRVAAPLQAALLGGLQAVGRSWRRYIRLGGVERENETLRAELKTLRFRLREAEAVAERLNRYERLLDFRTQRGVETLGAQVIARPSAAFVRALRVRIDRDQAALRAGMPVVTAEGVVGKISRAYGNYADVLLAVDARSAIDVIDQRTATRGMLRGVDGSNRLACRLDYVLRGADVRVGDVLLTSGAEGLFPEKLPVGRVVKADAHTVGLYQDVEVEPSVDLSALREVLIVLAPPPPAVSAAHQALSPAHGFVP